jgi:hypothetical protein
MHNLNNYVSIFNMFKYYMEVSICVYTHMCMFSVCVYLFFYLFMVTYISVIFLIMYISEICRARERVFIYIQSPIFPSKTLVSGL